jgi:hypothetical protein
MPFNTALTRKLGIKSMTLSYCIHKKGATNSRQSPLCKEA